VERGPTTCDLVGVPQGAVLIGQRDQVAVAEPGVPTGVVQQHHGQQAVYLRLVRHQLDERPAEPQRLRRQVAAAAVALVEDEVDDGQHRREAVGQQAVGRNPEGDGGGLDPALGPDQALRHRGLGYEEGAGDLVCGEPAERAQREGHLCLDRKRGVAAGEDQLQPLVGERRAVHLVLRRLLGRELGGLGLQRLLAAGAVDGPVAGRRQQPGSGIGGIPVARPALGGDGERLLGRFLGEVEITEEADQRSEHTAPLVAEGLLEDRYHSMIGRTSIAPPRRAAGILAATSMAASRSSAS
jgi:hypothetical protein